MEDFKVTQGRIVLYRVSDEAKNRYWVALINSVNDDGSVNLTLFLPTGLTEGANSVTRGSNVGDWTPPGVDSNQKE
jgi:hypothetical protein